MLVHKTSLAMYLSAWAPRGGRETCGQVLDREARAGGARRRHPLLLGVEQSRQVHAREAAQLSQQDMT